LAARSRRRATDRAGHGAGARGSRPQCSARNDREHATGETMRVLFGTDGIRGKAHEYPLDTATMFALGVALAHRLKGGRVLLGMDTRESGPEIASALAAGMAHGGGEA